MGSPGMAERLKAGFESLFLRHTYLAQNQTVKWSYRCGESATRLGSGPSAEEKGMIRLCPRQLSFSHENCLFSTTYVSWRCGLPVEAC
jgi:hypothetical protein